MKVQGEKVQSDTPVKPSSWRIKFRVKVQSDAHCSSTVFPRSDAAATINFPLLALAATIRGRRVRPLFEGGVYSRAASLQDSLLFSSINFDYVMFKSTIFGSDYC